MKIAILSPFYPYRGGIAQFSERLYQELSKVHEVEVFSYKTLYPKLFFPGKTQYVPNPISDPKLPNNRILSTMNLFSHKQTAEAINKFNPDVLITAYWMPYLAVALSRVYANLNKSIKKIGLVHNAIPHERSWLNRPLAMRFFRLCDAFICMSDNVQQDLISMGLKQPILVSEHPIYDHYFSKITRGEACRQLDLDPEKKTILFFGLIRAYKGLDLLIEAMGKLDDSYQLVVAGECYGSFESYQQLIDLSKNKDNIKVWNQYIPDDLVSVFFSAAEVLILPYRSATQSGVVGIAYQMEVPMIATDVGALGTTLKDAGTGLVVPIVSAEFIALGIEKFFSEDYKSKYNNNLRKEKDRLSWSGFVATVEPFFVRLIHTE